MSMKIVSMSMKIVSMNSEVMLIDKSLAPYLLIALLIVYNKMVQIVKLNYSLK